MFDCLRDKPKPIIVNPSPINVVNSKIIALVIPHNKKKQGAVSYTGESEYVFHKRIITKARIKLEILGYTVVIIERPVGSYSYQCRYVAEMCVRYKVAYSLHLHFNGATYEVLGCEVWIAATQTKLDNKLADIFTDLLNERYGFKERGNDGCRILSSNHSGYGMMNAVSNIGVICALSEVCFANFRTKESMIIFEQEDKYVDVIVDTFVILLKEE